MKRGLDFIKEYWVIFAFVLPLLGTYVVWQISLASRTFDSPEQKVENIKFVEESPGPKEQWQKYYRDSIDIVHRQKEREKRTEMLRIRDSIDRKEDSLMLDMLTRQTIQLEQLKDEVKDHHGHE